MIAVVKETASSMATKIVICTGNSGTVGDGSTEGEGVIMVNDAPKA